MWGAMCRTGEILLGLVVQLQATKDVACGFVLARSVKNLCSSSLFDVKMTIKCTTCSWYRSFYPISHHHRVLYQCTCAY